MELVPHNPTEGVYPATDDYVLDNIVRLTSCLRDASYAEANGAARVRALGGRVRL